VLRDENRKAEAASTSEGE